MIARKIIICFFMALVLPQALASNNTSSQIQLMGPMASSDVNNQQKGRNPFTGEGHTQTSSPVMSLTLQENSLLSQEINKWVIANGYKLLWNSNKDYLVYNNITLSGKTDDDILQALGELFFSENYGLVVKKYQKNNVIVIDEM